MSICQPCLDISHAAFPNKEETVNAQEQAHMFTSIWTNSDSTYVNTWFSFIGAETLFVARLSTVAQVLNHDDVLSSTAVEISEWMSTSPLSRGN